MFLITGKQLCCSVQNEDKHTVIEQMRATQEEKRRNIDINRHHIDLILCINTAFGSMLFLFHVYAGCNETNSDYLNFPLTSK